ncbi:MAG: ABC transporter substrate-binding protein, partial [Firmicutes bacterium]|nr:ABC transporter substrate-binding protein [Bacillota bacterium]
VRADRRKEKIKLIAYNDESDVSTATNLYNQLITQDKVNIFVSDFGSVLTSIAIPIAEENKVLLFDQSGSGATFFTTNNPYLVLTSLPTSRIWPDSLAHFLVSHHITRPAILYDQNDFDQSQDSTLLRLLSAHHIRPVYNSGVATSTSNYSVLLHDMVASHPDMAIELGYPNNDISYLQALQSSGIRFPKDFVIFPGQLPALFEKNFPIKVLSGLYTYLAPPFIRVKGVNFGPTLPVFERIFSRAMHSQVNFLNVAGYNTGLIIEKTLETSPSLNQLAMRHAIARFSGKIITLDGRFAVDASGAQVGEYLPVGQVLAHGPHKLIAKVLT